jgi:hypothetical protein
MVEGDVAEQAVLDAVPLRGAGREMADGDGQAGLGGQRGKFGFPGAGAVTVGATRISGDQQSSRLRIGLPACSVPPAANRLHREGGSVMVGAHVHPPAVSGQVIHPVGHGLAQFLVGKIVGVHLDRIAGRAPFASGVFELADQFFLLGVHADDRIACVLVAADLLVEVAKLRVAIGMLLTLQRFGIALQTEALCAQQLGDRVRGDSMTVIG